MKSSKVSVRLLLLPFLVFSVALCSPPAHARQPCPSLKDSHHIGTLLRMGGLVILIRHAESHYVDAPSSAVACDEPDVVLSPAGEAQATRIGSQLTRLQVPIAVVLYSPSCRGQRTAQLVFPSVSLRREPRLAIGSDNGWITEVLTTPLEGGNLALVTHGTVISEVKIDGRQLIDGYADNGLAAIFDPSQRSIRLLGCLRPSEWSTLSHGPSRRPNLALQGTQASGAALADLRP